MKYIYILAFTITIICDSNAQKISLGDYFNGTLGKEMQYMQFCDSTTYYFTNNKMEVFSTLNRYTETTADEYLGSISQNYDTLVLTKWLKPFIVFQIVDSLNLLVLSSSLDYCKPGEYFHKEADYFGKIANCGLIDQEQKKKWKIIKSISGNHYIKKIALDDYSGLLGEIREVILPLTIYK